MAPHPHLTEAARPAATTEAVLQVQATAEDHQEDRHQVTAEAHQEARVIAEDHREVIEDSHIKIADI